MVDQAGRAVRSRQDTIYVVFAIDRLSCNWARFFLIALTSLSLLLLRRPTRSASVHPCGTLRVPGSLHHAQVQSLTALCYIWRVIKDFALPFYGSTTFGVMGSLPSALAC